MDTLPTELLRDILSRCSEYAPILKEACYEWNEILSEKSVLRTVLSFEQMAERGHIDLLEHIGKDKINAKIIPYILIFGAKGGHLNIMILAREWGADDYNWALVTAVANGQLSAMRLLKEWGATDYNFALAFSAMNEQIPAMHLLKEWGATNYNSALAFAAMNGQILAMRLLKEWGVDEYDDALMRASEFGQIPAMHLLKEWGATAYAYALFYGFRHTKVVKLLKSWMNDETADE